MSTPEVFTVFSSLPVELRVKIWDEALSVRAFWAVVPQRALGHDLKKSSKLVCIGPAPCLVGATCKEAREIMKSVFGPIRGSNGRVLWADLTRTVIHLGNSADVYASVKLFHEEDLQKFKHVALAWKDFDTLVVLCRRLTRWCGNLETLIADKGDQSSSNPKILTPIIAQQFAIMPITPESDLGYTASIANHTREVIQRSSKILVPRLVILPD